jgi:hypothetical protein
VLYQYIERVFLWFDCRYFSVLLEVCFDSAVLCLGSLTVGRVPGSGAISGKLSRVQARNPLAPWNRQANPGGKVQRKYKIQKAFK